MKNEFLKFQWGFLLILIAIVAQSSCISENSDPVPIPDQNADLENVVDESVSFPLENLRMDPTTLKMLANLRAATAKYHRIEVAIDAGYELGSGCVSSPAGGMGFHYVKFGIVNGVVDPTQPEALLYEMDKHGKLKLVAVEFIVVAAAWDPANPNNPPYFSNQPFDDHRDYLTMGGPQFPHYQLHAWIWKNNPSGIFTKFNPNVKCGNN